MLKKYFVQMLFKVKIIQQIYLLQILLGTKSLVMYIGNR
jgi:hypothetical protein